MIAPQESSVARLLTPYPLFAGIVISFFACCTAGSVASGQNHYRAFERFNDFIQPTTLFYPTASQIQALGQDVLDPNKIIVVVGGNSVLRGDGQGQALWTRKLQGLLGPKYQVINFASKGAAPAEFGAIAAEILARDFKRLILIVNTWPFTVGAPSIPDGRPPYQQFFWDASWKGLLASDPERGERLRELARERQDDQRFAELQREMQLDSSLHFHDLWTTLAYTSISTVWTPRVGKRFLKPRGHFPDDGTVTTPKEHRYPAIFHQDSMKKMRRLTDLNRPVLTLAASAGSQAAPMDFPTASDSSVDVMYKQSFPEPFRKRTLILVNHYSPYYTDQLPSEEQAIYAASSPVARQMLEHAGFPTLDVGSHFSASDYVDLIHLSEEGGGKMADAVAPTVCELAKRLGYLEEGTRPE